MAVAVGRSGTLGSRRGGAGSGSALARCGSAVCNSASPSPRSSMRSMSPGSTADWCSSLAQCKLNGQLLRDLQGVIVSRNIDAKQFGEMLRLNTLQDLDIDGLNPRICVAIRKAWHTDFSQVTFLPHYPAKPCRSDSPGALPWGSSFPGPSAMVASPGGRPHHPQASQSPMCGGARPPQLPQQQCQLGSQLPYQHQPQMQQQQQQQQHQHAFPQQSPFDHHQQLSHQHHRHQQQLQLQQHLQQRQQFQQHQHDRHSQAYSYQPHLQQQQHQQQQQQQHLQQQAYQHQPQQHQQWPYHHQHLRCHRERLEL
mmetsp:Transcript_330/g.881  ORF Transcript_330/g.881 Transcript_330/m.881 type:complete len:310 (+) Transcript_330:51-980(+)